MTKLPTIDVGFLLTESHHSPKHVAGLQIFRLPKGKGSAWLRKLLDEMRQVPPGYPFNQRLKKDVIQPELEFDDHFEIDYHVRHTVLPGPGSKEQLLDVVARMHANLLDRERPLWEFHLIEGISARRFAFYTKIHHVLCDGITFARWFAESGSKSATDMNSRPIWQRDEIPDAGNGEDVSYAQMIIDGVKMLGGGFKTALGVSALSAKLLQRRFFDGDSNIALPLSAPRTALNVAPGAARNLTFTQYPLEEVRAIAHSQGGSINDLVLTICDLAVNRYFEETGQAPEEPLIAYMPVNLRHEKEQDNRNLISLLQVKMASAHKDPLAALQEIIKSSRSARDVFSSASRPAIQYYTLLVALLSQFEETLKLDKFLPPAINMVISNLPGPRKTMYFRGAEVVEVYPVSTLPPMTALNVTACSYADTIYFGLVSGRTAVPDLQKLTDYLDEAYADLREKARKK
jgi:diacylglycerol O-acyltransferase